MAKYILRRVLLLIPVIIGVTFMVYFIISLTPGDPVKMILGDEPSKEAEEQLRAELGLDQPIIVQYGIYMANLLQGDMGESYKTGKSVFSEIISRFPTTLQLTIGSMFVAIIVAVPIGIISATKQYSLVDSFSMLFALLAAAMPSFWLGLLLILLFSVNLGWLPSGGMNDGIKSVIMPAIAYGTQCAAIIARMTRSSMLEVIRQDFIRTAKAKGVKKKYVVRKHALRNAMIPVVTVIGLQFGNMLGGAVLTETVFSLPGIGRLMVDSIKGKDTPLVLGCIIFVAVTFSAVNLLVDILYAFIDPRIKSTYK